MELTPTEPKRFFEESRREKGRELDLVDDIEDEILDALDERYHDNLRTSHGEDRWRILRGRDRIQEETVEALEAAREEVRLLCGEPGGWLSPPGEAEVFSHLPEKAGDLDARALVGTDGDGVDRASKVDVLKPVALRTVDGPLGASSCLVDGEVFAGLVAGETPKCTMAIWSDAPGFYETQRRLFDGLWTTAAGTR